MYTYKLVKNQEGNTFQIDRSDGLVIPCDDDNTDYQGYLKWVTEGNTPEPADE